ncbi:hypothetical protein F443_21135, partial [Phytophthora nicotianae P1569]
HFNATSTVPFPRKENWTKHLDECLYYARVTGKSAQSDENQAETNESYAQADKHQRTSPPACTPVEIMIFWRLLLEFHAEALLPDSLLEPLSFRRLITFLNARCGLPGAVPHRHVIGDHVLDEYATQNSIEQRDIIRAIQDRSGGRVNFLSDVWETIVKQHILDYMISLFGCVVNYGLRPAGDRHDRLAIAKQMEVVIEELLASDME